MGATNTCWGYGIHDSDSALEWEFSLKKVSGITVRTATADGLARQRIKLEQGIPKMFDLISEEAKSPGGEALVAQGYQVMASLLMESGCAFSENVRARLAKGIEACPEYTMAKILRAGTGKPLDALRVFHVLPDHGHYGPQGTAERLNGRYEAIEHLLKMLGGYDLTGVLPVILTSASPLVPHMSATA